MNQFTFIIIFTALGFISNAECANAQESNSALIITVSNSIELPNDTPKAVTRSKRLAQQPSQQSQWEVVQYHITLKHPVSKRIIFSKLVASGGKANMLMSQYRQYHWKLWKYNGIGQSLKSRLFTNKHQALEFTPPSHFLGFEQQYVQRGLVSVEEVTISDLP